MYTTEQTMQIAGKLAGNYGRYLTEADREDMAQEIALAMTLAGEKADQRKNVEAYQFTTGKGIALNTVNRIVEHNNRHETLNISVGESEDLAQRIDQIEATDKGYVQATVETELANAIANAIESLPVVQASAVKRIMQEGATLETFGKEQGFSKEYARQVLTGAKSTLAMRLADWESTLA